MMKVNALTSNERVNHMTPHERKKKILEALILSGKVDIFELVELLNVSAMTVRRDLDELEKQKKLIRTHGGAALPQVLIGEKTFEQKMSHAHAQKAEIAEKAVKLIKDGMTILLDSGTTTFEIAKRLKQRTNLTVVTNDIKIASEIMDSKLEIILIGGRVQNDVGAVFGPYAEGMLKNIHVDIFFLGAHAVHASFGITAPTFEKASIKQEMIKAAESVYLVADATKFDQKSFAKICDVDSVTGIITDQSLPAETEEVFIELTDFIKGVNK